MKIDCDVLVVGAGPAGLSTAIESAKNGLKTIIIEKSSEIGYPVKTSAATWMSVIQDFKISKESICQTMDSIYIHSISSKKDVEVRWNQDVLCTLQFHKFLQELTFRAIRNGANLILPATVSDVLFEDSKIVGVVINTLNKTRKVRAKITIDASGPSAVIAKKLGRLDYKGREFGVGMEYEMKNVKLKNPKRMEFYVGYDIVPVGYGWVFPTGLDEARVGICTIINNPTREYEKFKKETGKDIYDCFDKLLNEHPIVSKIVKKAQPIEFHSGSYPLCGQIKKPYASGLLIVGDAAAQASPLLGEGIRFAMICGRYAANIAKKAIKMNDYSEDALRDYQRKCEDYLGKKFDLSLDSLKIETDEYWDKTIEYIKQVKRDGNKELILKYLMNEIDEDDYSTF